MVSENIYSDYSVIELWVSWLQDFIVGVLFIIQSVKTLKQKFKNCS